MHHLISEETEGHSNHLRRGRRCHLRFCGCVFVEPSRGCFSVLEYAWCPCDRSPRRNWRALTSGSTHAPKQAIALFCGTPSHWFWLSSSRTPGPHLLRETDLRDHFACDSCCVGRATISHEPHCLAPSGLARAVGDETTSVSVQTS